MGRSQQYYEFAPLASSTTDAAAATNGDRSLELIRDDHQEAVEAIVRKLIEKVQRQEDDIKKLKKKVAKLLGKPASRSGSPEKEWEELIENNDRAEKIEGQEEKEEEEEEIDIYWEREGANSLEKISFQPGDGRSPTAVDERYFNRIKQKVLFPASTHRFLIMDYIHLDDGAGYRVSLCERAFAIIVILFQFFAYLYIWVLMSNQGIISAGGADAPIEIDKGFCYDTSGPYGENNYFSALWNDDVYSNLMEGYANSNTTATQQDFLLQSLKCSDPREDNFGVLYSNTLLYVWVPGVLVFLLMVCFLMPEFLEAFVLFQCPGRKEKVLAVILYLESLLALSLVALGLNQQGSVGPFEAFFLVVGVGFVHELDDAVGSFFDAFHSAKRPRSGVSYGVFLLISAGLANALSIGLALLFDSFFL